MKIIHFARIATKEHIIGLVIAVAGTLSFFTSIAGFRLQKSLTELHNRKAVFETLNGEVGKLDEVLTMSAKMAAATGDLAWEERYNKFAPILDSTIKILLKNFPELEVAKRIEDANLALVDMERESFSLLKKGRGKQAIALLNSRGYEKLKEIYSFGMRDAGRLLESMLTKRLKDAEWETRALAILALSLLGFSIVGWMYVFRRLKTSIVLQNELQESKRELELIADNVPGVVSRVDRDGRYVYANKTYEIWFGLDRKQLIGSTHRTVLPPNVYARAEPGIRRALAGQEVRYESEVVTVAGKKLSVYATLIPYKNFNGDPDGFFTFVSDITEIKRSEQKFATLFQASPTPYFFFDDSGIIDCNMAAVQILEGKNKDEILSKHPADFSPTYQLDGKTSQQKSVEMDRLAREKGLHRFEWIHKTLSGKDFPVEVTLAPIKLEGRDVLLVSWSDLTQIKEKEEKLLQSSKMSSLGEMAGGIAHEINNPLAIIKGKANYIKKQIKNDVLDKERINEDLTKIEMTTDRIAKIIRGLRSFSRNATADPMEEVLVSSIVNDTLELCRERFRNHSIDLRVSGNMDMRLECRSAQISQVLINLLGNAHDAVENLSEKWVSIEVVSQKDCILINVMDSGKGIPGPVAEKMMLPFFTTKEVGKGTGLGLSISIGIAKEHHGKLKYDAQSKNTKFVLQLPLKQPKTITTKKEAA